MAVIDVGDLLDTYRGADGPRIVQGGALRALVGEVDRLRAELNGGPVPPERLAAWGRVAPPRSERGDDPSPPFVPADERTPEQAAAVVAWAERTEARRAALAAAIVAVARAGDDLGDVLSGALGRAADELGGVEELVAGRPGSWEADHVRALTAPYAADGPGA